jgi:hypothetical protein
MTNHSLPTKGQPIAGIILIAVGILFLVGQIFGFGGFFGYGWPLLVILPGAAFLYAAFTGDKQAAGLAVPGAVIGGTGLILFYQNMTNHWESWAYAWTLYPLFVGLALTFIGRRQGSEGTIRTGQGMVRWSGVAFIVAAIFFEIVLFGRGGVLSNLALPIVLIGIGLVMLYRRGNFEKRKVESIFTGPAVVTIKPKNVTNPSLQQQIDEALAEDPGQPVK